jgi:hypothetical protein
MSKSTPVLFAIALFAAVPACASEQVALPQFSFVELRGRADVAVVPGATERVTVVDGNTRTSRLHVDAEQRLVIETCATACPASYRLRVEIQSPHVLPIAIKDGGQIIVASGFPAQDKLFAAVDGTGRLDTRALKVGDVFAAAKGGGELLVRADTNLFGVSEGGGRIRYWGTPRLMTKGASGGVVQSGP